MPMDATAMQSGDQGLPQAASQSSASARLQQIDPRLVSAVIESLSASDLKPFHHKLHRESDNFTYNEVSMNAKQRTKWWVDVILFTCLIIAFFLDFTGVTLHQWIGVFIAALAVYHLLAHWGWVSSITQRFLNGASGKARLYYVLDAAVFAGLALIAATGLVISTWLNLALANYSAWLAVHITVSILTLVALLLKLALHWRWIASTSRKIFALPVAADQRTPGQQPAHLAGAMSRQEFIKVMGVVGLASFLALTNATGSLGSLQGAEASVSPDVPASSSADSKLLCREPIHQQRIRRQPTKLGDVIPLHPRRAAHASCAAVGAAPIPGIAVATPTSNNNNRCDLGECL